LHIFDATVMPPRQVESILLRDEPGSDLLIYLHGWIAGREPYPLAGMRFGRS
jgi:hypothetical protein